MLEENNTNKIIQNRRKKKQKSNREAIITSKQNQYVPIPKSEEIILSIENMDLRTVNGRLQIRTREGVAVLKVKGGSNFTTTSTSWVDVTGLPSEVEIPTIIKKKQTKLKRILSQLEKSRGILKKIAENSPLELEWLDVDLGIIKARFRPKKRQ